MPKKLITVITTLSVQTKTKDSLVPVIPVMKVMELHVQVRTEVYQLVKILVIIFS